MITITYSSSEYQIIKAIGDLVKLKEVATYNDVRGIVSCYMNGEHFHEMMAKMYEKRIFFIFPHGHVNAHKESFIVDDDPVIVLAGNPFDIVFDGAITTDKLANNEAGVSKSPEVTSVFDIAKMVFIRNHSVTHDEFFSKFRDMWKSEYDHIKTELMREDIDGILDTMMYCQHVVPFVDDSKECVELNEFWNGPFGISYYSPVYDSFTSFIVASEKAGKCSLKEIETVDVNNVSLNDLSISLDGLRKNDVLVRCDDEEGLHVYKRGDRPVMFYGALDINHTDEQLTEIVKKSSVRPLNR